MQTCLYSVLTLPLFSGCSCCISRQYTLPVGDGEALLELEPHFEAVKDCPFCKQAIVGIYRYGRVDKKRAMDLTEKKAATANRQEAQRLRLVLQTMMAPQGGAQTLC